MLIHHSWQEKKIILSYAQRMTDSHPFFIYWRIISFSFVLLLFLFRVSKPKLFLITYECQTHVLSNILRRCRWYKNLKFCSIIIQIMYLFLFCPFPLLAADVLPKASFSHSEESCAHTERIISARTLHCLQSGISIFIYKMLWFICPSAVNIVICIGLTDARLPAWVCREPARKNLKCELSNSLTPLLEIIWTVFSF